MKIINTNYGNIKCQEGKFLDGDYSTIILYTNKTEIPADLMEIINTKLVSDKKQTYRDNKPHFNNLGFNSEDSLIKYIPETEEFFISIAIRDNHITSDITYCGADNNIENTIYVDLDLKMDRETIKEIIRGTFEELFLDLVC